MSFVKVNLSRNEWNCNANTATTNHKYYKVCEVTLIILFPIKLLLGYSQPSKSFPSWETSTKSDSQMLKHRRNFMTWNIFIPFTFKYFQILANLHNEDN